MERLGQRVLCLLVLIAAAAIGRRPTLAADQPAADFPPELVEFVPSGTASLLAGTGQDTWDRQIRERGCILREGQRLTPGPYGTPVGWFENNAWYLRS